MDRLRGAYERGPRQRVSRRPSLAATARASPRHRPYDDYDWEAAAQRRPGRHECERVILHADRSIEARMSSTRYYGTEATARLPEPWPEADAAEAAPRLQVVKRRVPRWRLGSWLACSRCCSWADRRRSRS